MEHYLFDCKHKFIVQDCIPLNAQS